MFSRAPLIPILAGLAAPLACQTTIHSYSSRASSSYCWYILQRIDQGVAVGDFDGDGHADISLTPVESVEQVGICPVYYVPSLGPHWGVLSGATGQSLLLAPPVSFGVFSSGAWVSGGAGDFNGDGYDDVVRSDGLLSFPFTWQVVGGPLGASLASGIGAAIGIGDVNADGFDDLAVWSSPDVQVLRGPDAAVIHTWPGLVTAGTPSIASGGDVDGDGFMDILVGDGAASTVHVMSGRTGSAIHVLVAAPTEQGFGVGVSGIGDVDRDGFDDFSVGAFAESIVYSGQTGAELWRVHLAPTPGRPTVLVLGDLDGDARDDLLAGNRVLSGADLSTLTFVSSDDVVVPVGDVNANGSDDLLVWSAASAEVLDFAGTGSFGHEWARGVGCGDPAVPRRARIGFRGHAQIGQVLEVSLRGAAPAATAVLHIGMAVDSPLDVLGATGCSLYSVPFTGIRAATNAAGVSGFDFALTSSVAPVGTRLDLQWAILDPFANALGVSLSDALVIRLGQ